MNKNMSITMNPSGGHGIIMELNNDTVKITGSTKTSYPSTIMTPFFEELHNKMLFSGEKGIKINIKQLGFLNSAGIKEIVNWILKIEKLQEEKKYHVTFIYDPEISWQESFVSSMVYLNKDFIAKEVS
jgi:hypothetical protein